VRISSTQNAVVKYFRSLERTQVRQEKGAYLIEGVRLVREALDTRQQANIALFEPGLLNQTEQGSLLLTELPRWADRAYEVDERVLKAASQTEQPAGVVVVLKAPQPRDLSQEKQKRLGVILDRLRDPGNVGTIIRTTSAAGADYLVSLSGTVDLFAPKVVRAGMGAHFRLPLYPSLSWNEVCTDLGGTSFVGMDIGGRERLYEFKWPERAALIVGSEAGGISKEVLDQVTAVVSIPMRAGTESLNAATAASIVLYSALGQSL
jgi:RNA methyltransferase, TrmH family